MATQSTNAAVDVVGVFDSEFRQLFSLARPLKGMVREEAKVMEHPVESGSSVADHRVILPVEMELTLMLAGEEYRDTYSAIKDAYLNTELLTVQTKTGSYSDMIIAGMPHEEVGEIFDAVPLYLQLKEVKLVTAQFQALPPAAVKKKSDASTVKRGEQTAKPEPVGGDGKRKSSILYGILKG